MPKITIELTQVEMDALTGLAQKERRTPAMHAAHLVGERCLAITFGVVAGLRRREFAAPADWSEDQGEV